MEVQQDFKEMLELLNSNEVEYVIVGGYAVAFHGNPRFTGDIDIYVNPTQVNAEKVLSAQVVFKQGEKPWVTKERRTRVKENNKKRPSSI